MKESENPKGEKALNIASMVSGLLGVVGSVLAQKNGVSGLEFNVLGIGLALNLLFSIFQSARWVPHALELNTIEDPVERKAHFFQLLTKWVWPF